MGASATAMVEVAAEAGGIGSPSVAYAEDKGIQPAGSAAGRFEAAGVAAVPSTRGVAHRTVGADAAWACDEVWAAASKIFAGGSRVAAAAPLGHVGEEVED